jgi:hypothetical protein
MISKNGWTGNPYTTMSKCYVLLFFLLCSVVCQAQTRESQAIDSLTIQILKMQGEVDHIKLNLGLVENRFKTGIFISTLGYSTVIAGGLMLGRKNDDLGKALLVTGGAAGVTGTILMVDAFKFLGIASGKKQRKSS